MEVDRHHELASFLRAKRAQVNVEQTPLAHGGSRRRVPGLRREEVAELAHISLTYYTRLERGKVPSFSGAVLDGLVGALRLSPDERAYITSLIPISEELTRRNTRDGLGAQEALMRRFLDDLRTCPAYVLDLACTIVVANDLARALYRLHFDGPGRGNAVRFLFLDPRARDFFVDWRQWADEAVQYLRASRARYPQDAGVNELVCELHAACEEFRTAWEAHEVTYRATGRRRLRHPEVGELELEFLNLDLEERQDVRLTVYSALPGSPSAERLAKLRR